MLHQTTNVMRTIWTMQPSSIKADQRVPNKFTKQRTTIMVLWTKRIHGKVVGKIIGGSIPSIHGIERSITIHGGNREQQTALNPMDTPVWCNDISNELLQPFCGICILSRLEHVEASGRNARRASVGKIKADTWTSLDE